MPWFQAPNWCNQPFWRQNWSQVPVLIMARLSAPWQIAYRAQALQFQPLVLDFSQVSCHGTISLEGFTGVRDPYSEPETQNASLLGIQRGKFESLKNSQGWKSYTCRATKPSTADWAVQPLKVLMQPQNLASEKRLLKWASWEVCHVFWSKGRKRVIYFNISFLEMLTSLYFTGTWITLRQRLPKSCILRSSSLWVRFFSILQFYKKT